MSKWIHNLSGGPKEYLGRVAQDGEFIEIVPAMKYEFSVDQDLLTDLIAGSVKISADGSTDLAGGPALHVNYLVHEDPTPRDSAGRPIGRNAVTNEGWSYQIQAVEFTTSKLGGYYNRSVAGVDLGFITHKIFDDQGVEITDAQNEGLAVMTQMDWMVNHEIEMIGGQIFHAAPPTGDCRIWITAAPGILNINFGTGGMNMKHVSVGSRVDANGRAAKYLPTTPPGINRFRITMKHDQGLVYTGMILFEMFKP